MRHPDGRAHTGLRNNNKRTPFPAMRGIGLYTKLYGANNFPTLRRGGSGLTGRGFREGFFVEHAGIPSAQGFSDPARTPRKVAIPSCERSPFRAKNKGFFESPINASLKTLPVRGFGGVVPAEPGALLCGSMAAKTPWDFRLGRDCWLCPVHPPFARGGHLSRGCMCRDQWCEERSAEGRVRGAASAAQQKPWHGPGLMTLRSRPILHPPTVALVDRYV